MAAGRSTHTNARRPTWRRRAAGPSAECSRTFLSFAAPAARDLGRRLRSAAAAGRAGGGGDMHGGGAGRHGHAAPHPPPRHVSGLQQGDVRDHGRGASQQHRPSSPRTRIGSCRAGTCSTPTASIRICCTSAAPARSTASLQPPMTSSRPPAPQPPDRSAAAAQCRRRRRAWPTCRCRPLSAVGSAPARWRPCRPSPRTAQRMHVGVRTCGCCACIVHTRLDDAAAPATARTAAPHDLAASAGRTCTECRGRHAVSHAHVITRATSI